MKRLLLLAIIALLAPRTVHAQSSAESYFIDISQTFARHGDYVYQAFTVYEETTFDLRFAVDYEADAAIIRESELSNFISGRAYRGYGLYDGVFGTQTSVTIPAGRYYAAVRNETSASNTIRFEVDYSIQLPDAYFYDWYFGDAMTVDAYGGTAWQEFTIERDVRYFLDGCNSGLEVYIIPRSELSNFRAGRAFRYYTDYSGEDNAYPGLWELHLNPGDYALVFRNQDEVDHTVTWQAERWIPSFGRTSTPLGAAATKTVAPTRNAESQGLRSARLVALNTIRLVFGDRLDTAALSRSQFTIAVGDRTVWPSSVTYDASTGTVSLTAPELATASGNVTVSWTGLRTTARTLNGSTDPLSVRGRREPQLTTARATTPF